ncbi:MAG: hypothetical protein ORN51_00105 [Akkermansiaceae bacterium]|nr:hypothetical protein [Akkermansiaceae bacterium]
MKTSTVIVLVILASAASAFAHLTYTSRDFGTLNPGNETTSLTKSGSISSTFGWAYSTDADYGDSHRNRAFRFTLATAGQIQLSAQSTGPSNLLLPALSIYSGLAHIGQDSLDHDGTSLSISYLNGLFGPDVAQGSFNALGDWAIGNEDVYNTPGDSTSGIAAPASLSYFRYRGNVADGTPANYGSATGIQGDGNADGHASAWFDLPAGDYTVMVGGAQMYNGSLPAGPYTSYPVNVTLSVIPEASVPLLFALSTLGLAFRRR